MAIEKTSTGISGLDNILNGGYLKNKPTLLKGEPGSGKTIFTLFFAHAQLAAGERVVFVTCDEPPDQIIAHMDAFGLNGSKYQASGSLLILDFTPTFDDEIIGEFDLDVILLRIQQAKNQIKAKTLIIDSLHAMLLGLVDYDPEIELLHLFSWARNEKMTILTTAAKNLSLVHTELYEEYIVDCAIELSQQVKNKLMTRYLRVVKLRGSSHGTNEYPFAIINNGISLMPITETRLVNMLSKKYLSTGIKDLDRMFDKKGYQEGSSLMVSGRSGTGKTIFVSSMANAALQKKKKVLFISFEESPDDIVNHLQSVGIDFTPYLKKKQLHIDSRRSIEMGLEDHVISILDQMERNKFDLVVLDPISSLLDLGSQMELKLMFIRFIANLKSRNKTLIFTELLPDSQEDLSNLGLSSLTDTWIRLRHAESDGELNRMLLISKSRGTGISNQLKEFLITNKGITIEEPYIGKGEMVFGTKKADMILQEKQELKQHQDEIKHLNEAIKALEKRHAAQKMIAEYEFIDKKNTLLLKKQELLKQSEQIKARESVNKGRRNKS